MKITDKPHWHHACAERMLGLQKRTRANDNELRRMDCSYPLRFVKKLRLSRMPAAGNLGGNFQT